MVSLPRPEMIEASELESDRLVQRSFSDLEAELAAEEEAGPREAGAELEMPVAVEYWELVMAHCAFAANEKAGRNVSGEQADILPTYTTKPSCLEEHVLLPRARTDLYLYQTS